SVTSLTRSITGALFLIVLLALARSFGCFLCCSRGTFFSCAARAATTGLFSSFACAAFVLAVGLLTIASALLLAAALICPLLFLCVARSPRAHEPAHETLPESGLGGRGGTPIGARGWLCRRNAFDDSLRARFDFMGAMWG